MNDTFNESATDSPRSVSRIMVSALKWIRGWCHYSGHTF